MEGGGEGVQELFWVEGDGWCRNGWSHACVFIFRLQQQQMAKPNQDPEQLWDGLGVLLQLILKKYSSSNVHVRTICVRYCLTLSSKIVPLVPSTQKLNSRKLL